MPAPAGTSSRVLNFPAFIRNKPSPCPSLRISNTNFSSATTTRTSRGCGGWFLPLNSQRPCTVVHRDPANAGRRFIPLLLGDCALPDTLRRCKVVDFREESEAPFAEVPATLRDTLLPKLLSGEVQITQQSD